MAYTVPSQRKTTIRERQSSLRKALLFDVSSFSVLLDQRKEIDVRAVLLGLCSSVSFLLTPHMLWLLFPLRSWERPSPMLVWVLLTFPSFSLSYHKSS